MSNCLDPDRARHFVGPDLFGNVISRQQKSPLARKELRKKEYQQSLGLDQDLCFVS